jgi:hypothetical protein
MSRLGGIANFFKQIPSAASQAAKSPAKLYGKSPLFRGAVMNGEAGLASGIGYTAYNQARTHGADPVSAAGIAVASAFAASPRTWLRANSRARTATESQRVDYANYMRKGGPGSGSSPVSSPSHLENLQREATGVLVSKLKLLGAGVAGSAVMQAAPAVSSLSSTAANVKTVTANAANASASARSAVEDLSQAGTVVGDAAEASAKEILSAAGDLSVLARDLKQTNKEGVRTMRSVTQLSNSVSRYLDQPSIVERVTANPYRSVAIAGAVLSVPVLWAVLRRTLASRREREAAAAAAAKGPPRRKPPRFTLRKPGDYRLVYDDPTNDQVAEGLSCKTPSRHVRCLRVSV